LSIPGAGRLQIQPGGEETGDLARRRQAAQDDLNALLAELQVDNIDQAEQLAEARRTLQEDIKRDELLLQTLAPKGVDELQANLTLCQQRQQALTEQLAALPVSTPQDTSVSAAESGLEVAG